MNETIILISSVIVAISAVFSIVVVAVRKGPHILTVISAYTRYFLRQIAKDKQHEPEQEQEQQ